MGGAIDIIRNGRSQGDLNGQGYKLINWDTSNLQLGQLGSAPQHTVLAGPSSGADEIPTFRLLTADEVGAQPHSAGLDLLSPLTPTTSGIGLIELPNDVGGGYIKNMGQDEVNAWSFLTPTELRTDIDAQPLNATLTTLSLLTTTATGRNFLTLANPGFAGYAKIAADNSISVLTPAQLASDIGANVAPFVDTTALVKGSATQGKLFRIEVDQWAGAATRVMSPPDYDFVPASIGDIDHVESLIYKNINGLTLACGTAPDAIQAPTYNQNPGQPFQLALIGLGSSASLVCRVNAPADLLFPSTGTVATVETTMPLSYLSTETDLDDGSGASNSKVSTQLAVKTYVDNHIAATIGTGQDPEETISGEGESTIEPDYAYSQWYHVFNVSSAADEAYSHGIILTNKNVSIGAMIRIRLEFFATSNPTINLVDKTTDGAILQTVSGQADSTTVFVFEAIWNGISWKKYDGHYVI